MNPCVSLLLKEGNSCTVILIFFNFEYAKLFFKCFKMTSLNKALVKYIVDFLEYCEIEKGLSVKTVENYDRFLKPFVRWLDKHGIGDLSPAELSKRHIWDYRMHLARLTDKQGKMLKKSTQNYYLIALRALLSFFAERDIVCLPPEKIKLAKEDPRGSTDMGRLKFLHLAQLKALFAAPHIQTIQGLRDRAMLETLFSTGLRVSELAGLNMSQFNFSSLKSNPFKDLELSITGKGGRSRNVFFSARAVEWIIKYLNARNDDSSALFVTHHRGAKKPERLSVRSIQKAVENLRRRAGLSVYATPHTLRHSYATDLLEQGVDLRLIQEFLGHKNIVTTQIYTHVTNKKLRDIHREKHGGKRLQ